MSKFDISYIMNEAWDRAYAAADEFGGYPKQYFAEALRQTWADEKPQPLTRKGHRSLPRQSGPSRLRPWPRHGDQ